MNYATLVNKEHKIKSNYEKKINLVPTKDIDNEEVLVEEITYHQYLKLQRFLQEKGIIIGITSAYRTLEKQTQIMEEMIIKHGITYTNQVVAKPGMSEHHTGLALDISLKVNGRFLESTSEMIKNKEKYQNIVPYLSKFGFILRYPEEKEKITGYSYEPWHIRYVGEVVAKIIEKNKSTLEEYHRDFSGILVVNKQKGMTSFDVVKEITNLFGITKVGHTGTLDPIAEGVLVVTIGKATKIAQLLTAEKKEYQAGVLLGIKTDTLDITGTVIESKPVADDLEIEKVLKKYNKTYLQEVPIYSAVKVNGKKLYEYARKKEQVELPKKLVTIEKMQLLTTDHDTFSFQCFVSKGCYIRSLINDIGLSLNTYATMTKLVRTKQGKFTIEEASTLSEIKEGKFYLYKLEEALDCPVVRIEETWKKKIITGQKVPNRWKIKDKVLFKDQTGKDLGIYQVEEEMLKVWKNFSSASK